MYVVYDKIVNLRVSDDNQENHVKLSLQTHEIELWPCWKTL